ncbi:MAG: sigma-70 family RNA polymerase sigma factor [Chloroflexota bacterium]|nr:sigma-70 family RNA polymerase sigma factor [Chloroflexota bacterium]
MQREPTLSNLRRYIAEEAPALLRTLRFYLARAGVHESLDGAASELLNETVVQALRHEQRFRPDAQPRAWLLGIAANLIRRKQVETVQMMRREPLVRDLAGDQDEMSDAELFDRFSALANDEPDALDNALAIKSLLAGLTPEDQHILKLAIEHQLDGNALGRALGVSPGAARVRLHRALARARTHFASWKETTHE